MLGGDESGVPTNELRVDSEALVERATSKLDGLATDSTTVLSLLEVSVASLLQYVPSHPRLATPIIVVVGLLRLSDRATAEGNFPLRPDKVDSLALVLKATSRLDGFATDSTTVLSLEDVSVASLLQYVPSQPRLATPMIVVVGFERLSARATADGNFPDRPLSVDSEALVDNATSRFEGFTVALTFT